MKKVLFVATVARQHIMQFHLPYMEMFQKKGYEVHVAAKNDFLKGEETLPYCDVFYDLPFARNPLKKDNLKVYHELVKIIQENSYEIIHCHTPVGAALTRLAARKVKKHHLDNQPTVIYTAHGFHFFKGAPLINWAIYYPIEKYLAKDTDKLLTINQEDYALAKKHLHPKKLYYVHGVGVDFTRFSNPQKTREEMRQSLNIPENSFVLLSVGELNKNKNHRKVIEALGTIKNPNVTYVIAGLGDEKDPLLTLAKEKGVTLQLLGYRRDVPDLLNMADLYVFPSIREGLSLSLMEAMAAKKAILASDIRGNHDLIQTGENGELFPLSTSNEELGKQLQSFVENPKKVSQYGENAVVSVQDYALENVLPEMEKIYFDEK